MYRLSTLSHFLLGHLRPRQGGDISLKYSSYSDPLTLPLYLLLELGPLDRQILSGNMDALYPSPNPLIKEQADSQSALSAKKHSSNIPPRV